MIIYFEFLPTGEIITAKKYCDQLTNLDAVIQEKKADFSKSKIYHFPTKQPKPACFGTNLAESLIAEMENFLIPGVSSVLHTSSFSFVQVFTETPK